MNLLDLFVKIGVKDEASGAIDDVSQGLVGKLAGAAATAAKALAGAFVVKKVVDFGKAAFDSYSQFEQLAGGAEKIFSSLDQSKILADANGAFLTLNMSANEYLQSINNVGATFAQTMGQEKGYETAKRGMQAIADFASGTGANLEELNEKYKLITRSAGSYQSIADQFAGILPQTSSDFLEQAKAAGLLKDEYQSLTEVPVAEYQEAVTAMIEKGVEQQGLAGNTAAESLKTLSGSMAATKSAWQNLVTEFGKPDADIGARISDMFTAVLGENGEGGLLRNVTNEVGTIARNMIGAVSNGISAGIDWLSQNGSSVVEGALKAIGDAIGRAASGLGSFTSNFNLVDAIFGEGGVGDSASKVVEWVQGIGQTISDNWPYVQEQLGALWEQVVQAAETYGPQIMEVAGRLVGMARDAIVEHGPEILAKVGEVIGKVIAHIGTFVADMSAKGHEFMAGLITGTSDEGKKLHEWFANFFPSGLLKGLGDFATFLLDAGRALINGLLDGIGEVAPDVENAIRSAFDSVISFFETMGEFIQDPIGTIQRGFDALMGSSDDAASGVEKNMGKVEGSVDKSMTNASASLQKYNGTKLKDKSATAKVTGNAENGSAKKAVNDTNTAVQKLKDKSVSVDVKGNVTSGVAGGSIRTALDLIGKMKDKSVTLTTHNVTRNTKITETKQARGGIRRHARGDIFVADNPGYGVDVNAVKDIMGEAGPEAIVPLTSHYGKDFAQMMGKEAAKVMGGGPTVSIYMTYNAGEDATQLVSDIAAGLQLVL